jgi:hypothetical protein
MKNLRRIAAAIALLGTANLAMAQDVKLHVSSRWKECSFQLDPSLTQAAWHQFTREAGLVAYFRPLIDAKPMGPMHFELSILNWQTGIDPKQSAWNDTFVHPDSAHWLTEGPRLAVPGLTARMGLTKKIDAGIYWTKNVNANYGFYGGQIQYNLFNNSEKRWAASARIGFTSIYGPDDITMHIYGLDLIASKEFRVHSDWIFVSPYAGVSTYLSSSHESSPRVDLKDEHVAGGQAMIGTLLKISCARLGVEYNFAKVNTLSFKIGATF